MIKSMLTISRRQSLGPGLRYRPRTSESHKLTAREFMEEKDMGGNKGLKDGNFTKTKKKVGLKSHGFVCRVPSILDPFDFKSRRTGPASSNMTGSFALKSPTEDESQPGTFNQQQMKVS